MKLTSGIKLVLMFGTLAGCLGASTSSVQVQSLTGGFLAGCTPANGCGGEFQAMVNGTTTPAGTMINGNVLYVYCVDFENSVFIPSQVYAANVSSVTDGSDVSNTVYGRTDSGWAPGDPSEPIVFANKSFNDGSGALNPTPLQRYQMAAWLISQYAQPGSDHNAIQFAIWNALQVTVPAGDSGPSAPKVTGKTKTDETLLLQEAASFVASPDSPAKDQFLGSFHILTEVAPIYLHSPTQVQEFIYINPEPAHMMFLAALAFGGLVFAKSRRRSRA